MSGNHLVYRPTDINKTIWPLFFDWGHKNLLSHLMTINVIISFYKTVGAKKWDILES